MAATSGPAPTALSVKLHVGLQLLAETDIGEYDAAAVMLGKVLGNIAKAPEEEKFRSLRMGNPKISALLATRGVRALLTGVGFIEQNGLMVLPAGAPIDALHEAQRLMQAQQAERESAANAANAAAQAERMARAEKENEDRKRLKMQIGDDASARKEPGWKAKAAGVKEGKAITGCSDVGIGQDSGG